MGSTPPVKRVRRALPPGWELQTPKALRRGVGSPALFGIVQGFIAASVYFGLGLVVDAALGFVWLVYLASAVFFGLLVLSYVEGASLHQERGPTCSACSSGRRWPIPTNIRCPRKSSSFSTIPGNLPRATSSLIARKFEGLIYTSLATILDWTKWISKNEAWTKLKPHATHQYPNHRRRTGHQMG